MNAKVEEIADQVRALPQEERDEFFLGEQGYRRGKDQAPR